jgi:hypothetical protein
MVFKIGPLQSENIEVDEDQKKVNGINDFISTLPFCQSCLYGKQKRMKFLPRVVEKHKQFWSSSIHMFVDK